MNEFEALISVNTLDITDFPNLNPRARKEALGSRF